MEPSMRSMSEPSSRRSDPRQRLGRAGEDLAALYLAAGGYEIVARNVRTKLGEIDLLVRHDGVLIFVEVKTRRGDRFGSGADAVGYRKQDRLRRLALAYLGTAIAKQPIRFDVVDVRISLDHEPVIRHIANAF